MNTLRYAPEALATFLRERKVATMAQMKDALQTGVDLTVLRKLKQLGYYSSYSHRGAYYTLEEIVELDENGLWFFGPACFSRHGTLIATAEHLVNNAEAGYYTNELESLLVVGVKETMLKLYKQGRVSREHVQRQYLYCATALDLKRQQVLNRKAMESEPIGGRLPAGTIHDELKAAIILFFCLLDEQQRRLFAGLESLKWGRGGDRKVAELLGLDVIRAWNIWQ